MITTQRATITIKASDDDSVADDCVDHNHAASNEDGDSDGDDDDNGNNDNKGNDDNGIMSK